MVKSTAAADKTHGAGGERGALGVGGFFETWERRKSHAFLKTSRKKKIEYKEQRSNETTSA